MAREGPDSASAGRPTCLTRRLALDFGSASHPRPTAVARNWARTNSEPRGDQRWEGWGEQAYRPYRRRAKIPLTFGAGVYFSDDKLTEPLRGRGAGLCKW